MNPKADWGAVIDTRNARDRMHTLMETAMNNEYEALPELESYLVFGADGKPKTLWRQKGEGARLIAEKRERARVEEQRRRAGIERENLVRKLDAIDPDWHQKFISTDAALRFYREREGW